MLSIDEYLLIPPDWKDEIIYKRRWSTAVQAAVTRPEKRSALYTWPRRSLLYSLATLSQAETAHVIRRIFENLHNIWGIPFWQDWTNLTAQASAGQAVLAVESTANRNFEVGAPCIVLTDQDSYEVGEIQSMTATEITLTQNLSSTWPAATDVYPLLQARLNPAQKQKLITSAIGNIRIEAVEAFDSGITRSIGDASAFSTFLSFPVFDLEPDRAQDMEIGFSHPYNIFRSLGDEYACSDYAETALFMTGRYLFTARAAIQDCIDFFDNCMGRWGGFWVPTWHRDLDITAAFAASATQVSIEDIDYSAYWLNDCTGRHIFLIFPDDTVICMRVKSVPDSTTLEFDSEIGKACSADELPMLLTSFLWFARFDIDELEIRYKTLEIASTHLPFRSLLTYGLRSNGSAVIEGCSSLTGWTDNDNGTNAESSQVTFQGEECFKFDSGDQASGNKASRSKDLGSLGSRIVLTLRTYFDELGTQVNNDCFLIDLWDAAFQLEAVWGTDGLFIYNGSPASVSITFQTKQWHEWTFDIDASVPASATCDIYLDGRIEATGVDCSKTPGGDEGLLELTQLGYNTANRISYVDSVRLGDGLEGK